MKDPDFREIDVSEESLTFADIREFSGSESMESDCYKKCMNDAWDLKGESVCESVCAV